MTWDPQQYNKFAEFRLRAGHDLIAQIPMESYRVIYDLGCGSGELTRLLQRYWPNAKVIGIDASAEMLQTARQEPSAVIWEQQDAIHWQPSEPADLIFSNAVLQWLPNHQQLLLRLLSYLKPNGVLALQMSNNFNQPSHKNIMHAVRSGNWRKTLETDLNMLMNPVATPEQYFQMLASLTKSQNIWQTTYYHPLTGDNPVFEWVKGTFLKPMLDKLTEPERSQFETNYAERIKTAYPQRSNGITLFPFQRLFIIAHV